MLQAILESVRTPLTSTSLSPFTTSRWRPGGGFPALKKKNHRVYICSCAQVVSSPLTIANKECRVLKRMGTCKKHSVQERG